MSSKKKISVLYVEDELDLRVVLDISLKLIDWIEYDLVANGEDALDLISSKKYDVIVSDHYLPGIQGIDLLERLKTDNPEIKRFLITGSVLMSVIRDAEKRAEPLYIFDKPVVVEDVFSKIYELLN